MDHQRRRGAFTHETLPDLLLEVAGILPGGRLAVHEPHGEHALLGFNAGRLVRAVSGEVSDELVFERLARWPHGTYLYYPDTRETAHFGAALAQPLESLLTLFFGRAPKYQPPAQVQTVADDFLPVLRDALLQRLGPYGLLLLEDAVRGAGLQPHALSAADARGLMHDLLQQLPDDQRQSVRTLQADLERRFGL